MNRVDGGEVYLVGAGPGDPGLLTIRGRELLSRADVVIYDRLANSRLLNWVRPDAERFYVGKRTGNHTVDQQGINDLIVKKAREGKMVVRLKGGDPFIFGRGGEEAQVLAESGIYFEIVPGVTSAIAVPAYAGIPLTHRSHTASVAFITGHRKKDSSEADVDWEGLAKGVGTLVFLMGMKNLPHIAENLIRYGRRPDTPVGIIRWGTTPQHRSITGTLSDIAEKVKESGIKPPAIIVVGDVVALRDQIAWYEKRPLFGKRILVTRTRDQASALVMQLERRGARCVEFPTIEVVPPEETAPLDRAIGTLSSSSPSSPSSYDWVIFTSTNAVEFFFNRLFHLGQDVRALAGVRVAAVGTGTRDALGRFHIRVDMVPDDFRAEGLLEKFAQMGGVKGLRILLPRAEKARRVLPDGLRKLGAEVDAVTAYRTVAPSIDASDIGPLKRKVIDCVTFTSSSTVTNFFSMVPESVRNTILSSARVACIGPVTRRTAEKMGLSVDIMPDESTIPALVEAIQDFFSHEHLLSL